MHLSLSVTGTVVNMAVTALDADVTRQPGSAAGGYAKIAYRGAAAYVRFVVSGGDFFVSQEHGRWVEGRETVDGVHTVRITGEIAADVATKIVPQLHAAKRIPCTVWIQETGDHHLVALTLPTGEDAVQMNFSNWNAPVSIGRPGP